LKGFANLIAKYYTPNNPIEDADYAFLNEVFPPITQDKQQDTQEFITAIMMVINEKLFKSIYNITKKLTVYYPFSDVKETTRIDEEYMLATTLGTTPSTTLEELFKTNMSNGIQPGGGWSTTVPITKDKVKDLFNKRTTTTFTNLPDDLLIYIKRFDNKGNKLTNIVQVDTVWKGYKLKGFIHHGGGATIKSGHYMYFKYNEEDKTWIQFNGSHKGNFTEQDIAPYLNQGVIYYYERDTNTNTDIVLKQFDSGTTYSNNSVAHLRGIVFTNDGDLVLVTSEPSEGDAPTTTEVFDWITKNNNNLQSAFEENMKSDTTPQIYTEDIDKKESLQKPDENDTQYIERLTKLLNETPRKTIQESLTYKKVTPVKDYIQDYFMKHDKDPSLTVDTYIKDVSKEQKDTIQTQLREMGMKGGAKKIKSNKYKTIRKYKAITKSRTISNKRI
jgi:hypothetical protein